MEHTGMPVHRYYQYPDLSAFRVTEARSHMEHTRGGIPCEYYTAPRLVHEQKKEYTNYIIKYDINPSGSIVRVGIRLPRYVKDGTICTEALDTFASSFSPALIRELHKDYTSRTFTAEDLREKYPFSHNPSRDAYEMLSKYGHQYNLLPQYPSDSTHLWFFQTTYKRIKITFCYDCTEKPILFDTIVGDSYHEMAHRLKKNLSLQERKLYICMNACLELYDALHSIFPDAAYIFDATAFPQFFDEAARLLPSGERSDFFELRDEAITVLGDLSQLELQGNKTYHLYNTRSGVTDYLQQIYDAIQINLPKGPEKYRIYIDKFITHLNQILSENPDFISGFQNISQYHSLLPFDTVQFFKEKILTNHGYTPQRLAYVMLAKMRQKTPPKNPSHIYKKKNDTSMTYAPYFNTFLKKL